MCSVGRKKNNSTVSEPQYVIARPPRSQTPGGEQRRAGLDATPRSNSVSDATAAIAIDAGQPVPPRRTKKPSVRAPSQQHSSVTDGRRRHHSDNNDDVQNDDRRRTNNVMRRIDENDNVLHAAAAAAATVDTESEMMTDNDEYTRMIQTLLVSCRSCTG